jgi:hypothetical protein
MRKCKFNIKEKIEIPNPETGRYKKFKWVDNWQYGVFHQWGVDYEEFETGPGNFSVGIIETVDGKVHMPFASDIVFLDK